MSKQRLWTTKSVEDITEKMEDGFIYEGVDNPFFNKEIGIRKSGLSFEMTPHEIEEYIKCGLDLVYFAENYCWTKGDDGSYVPFKPREYQYDIFNNFNEHRFNILMASRQVGKCVDYNTLINIRLYNQDLYCRIGVLYYHILSSQRKLTFIEKVKIKLYDLLYKLEN